MDIKAQLVGETPCVSWLAPLRTALDAAPDPDRARRLAADLLGGLSDSDFEAIQARDPEKLARILYALCGIAPFFKPFLARHPDWLLDLLDDPLETARDFSDLAAALDAALDAAPDEQAEAVLRGFKYRELARITVRDSCDAWVPLGGSTVTLAQLSTLADVLLDRALLVAKQRVTERVGPPRWLTPSGEEQELAFTVLGLGKLGSEELNYSSDVDLVYLFQSAGKALRTGPTELHPPAWFTRLAQTFGKLVSDVTSDGFLYRVDLELRPDDTLGAPVLSDDAFFGYFEARADLWEKAAYMKARPVAGDIEMGWRNIRAIAPIIFNSGIDYRGVEAIRTLKNKVEQARGEGTGGFNVKIDRGGIRDIEFVAQALQLMHGGRVLQVRGRSTEGALESLRGVDLLAADDARSLGEGYRFLRRVENRLQMEAERQTHVIPTAPDARRRLARAVGHTEPDGEERFEAELDRHRNRIAGLADALVAENASDRILELFKRNVPRLAFAPGSAALVEDLANAFARQIDASPDPESALNNLDRFIAGVGSRSFYYELLIDRPEIIPRLTALFASSKFLSAFVARHPRLIEPVFRDPNKLLLTRDELRRDLESLSRSDDPDEDRTEQRLDALRLFHHRQVVNIGLLDISEEVTRTQAEDALTSVAETCLEGALALAVDMLASGSRPPPAALERSSFLVVGMGKLSSRELSYGSDLDVIFLYDTEEEGPRLLEAQEHFVRLTQRLISNLQTPTSEGACYEIDARLRPSGNQGTLVTSLRAFGRYHRDDAQVWERQALLRSRAVVGDPALADRFEAEREALLRQPPPPDLAAEIHRIRGRMEVELAQESSQRRDFKTGRGGLLDVEAAVQYLQLRHGEAHPELLRVATIAQQIDQLASLGVLDPPQTRVLGEGWEFLQRLGNRLRIVENRSISDLNVERGDLDGLAQRMGYPEGGRAGGARRALLRDYAHHTEAIRAAYLAILGIGEDPAD